MGSFFPFLLPRWRTGVFMFTPNKISTHTKNNGSATHVPRAHTFAVMSSIVPHHNIQGGVDPCVLKCVSGLTIVGLMKVRHSTVKIHAFARLLKVNEQCVPSSLSTLFHSYKKCDEHGKCLNHLKPLP